MTLDTRLPAIHSSVPPVSSLSPKLAAKGHLSPFTREFDFLLLCAKCTHGSELDDIRESIGDLDWESLLCITEHHRLIPQVYGTLRNFSDFVPKEVLGKLYNRYQANVRQTLRLTRDLVRVVRHFESRGIPVIAYKGPTLATILCGNVSGRQFADLDLMIHPLDVQNAKAALAQLGYVLQNSLTDRQEESYIRSGYEYAFDLPDAQNILELKWRILPHFYSIDLNVAAFFDRATTIEVGGYPALTLSSEDLLLVLCVHAAKHAWSELSLLWDISQLTRSHPINWESAYKRANQLGISRILSMNLALSKALLGITPPSGFSGRLETETGTGSLTTRIFCLVAKSQQLRTETLSYFRLMLSLRERRRDRANFLWRLLVTPGPREWSVVALPSWLFSFYYALRLLRLAARMMRLPAIATPAESKTTAAPI